MNEMWTGDPLGWRSDHPTVVAIGVFDGVHLGHRAVLADVVESARRHELRPVALTFDPHPLEFLTPDCAPKLLGSIEHRAELLWGCGVDVVGVLPFLQIRDLQPSLFAEEVLSDRLVARRVVVGADFRYGHDRRGDVSSLTAAGRRLGFEVEPVSLVEGDGEVVSSSRIRGVLETGDVAEAARLLGRPFELRGPVIHGDGRGATIGFPTANVHIPDRLAIPRFGVYAVEAEWDGESGPAVANLGMRPTFGESQRAIEVHMIGRSVDLYGAEVRLRFVARLRDEIRFEGVEALAAQIGADVEDARRLLGGMAGE